MPLSTPAGFAFALIIFPVAFVAFCTMLVMWINGIKHGDMTWYVSKGYNSKYRRIFAASVFTMVIITFVFNALIFLGFVKI